MNLFKVICLFAFSEKLMQRSSFIHASLFSLVRNIRSSVFSFNYWNKIIMQLCFRNEVLLS